MLLIIKDIIYKLTGLFYFFFFVRMHYIKYIFALVILCVIVVYVKRYEVSFDNAGEFHKLLTDFKYDIVLLNSKTKFNLSLPDSDDSPAVIVTTTARMLYETVSTESEFNVIPTVNWVDDWQEIISKICNSNACVKNVKGTALSGKYVKAYSYLTSVKDGGNTDAKTVKSAPGFLITTRMHNAKVRMFTRKNFKTDNYANLVTLSGAYENILLYSGIARGANLKHCLSRLLELFKPKQNMTNSWYPFAKLRGVGILSLVVDDQFDGDVGNLSKSLPLYHNVIKSIDMERKKKSGKYVYALIIADGRVDLTIVSRSSGMNGNSDMKLLTVGPAPPVTQTSDEISIIENTGSVFNDGHGHDDDNDSVADMNTESEFEEDKADDKDTAANDVKATNNNDKTTTNNNDAPTSTQPGVTYTSLGPTTPLDVI